MTQHRIRKQLRVTISDEARAMLLSMSKREGLSMSRWLERHVRLSHDTYRRWLAAADEPPRKSRG